MSNELVKPAAGGLAPLQARPTHIAERGQQGLENLASIVRPSFVKIVQKNSADEYTEKFGAGAIILTPDLIPLTTPAEDSAARFVPLMFYKEYCKWAPMALKGVEPMIVERSFDPNSSVGIKSSSPATWSERHPQHGDDPKYNYRYCEHLNYIIKLVDEDLMETEPVLVSFVKTNYTVGQRLAKLALARKADIFAGVYQLGTRTKENAQNAWKVFTVENDLERPWVADPDLYAAFKALHEHYLQLVKDQMIRSDYDIDAVDDDSVAPATSGKYGE